MLQTYSTNIAVAVNENIPFNNVSLIKGCTATKPSAATVNLNSAGIYRVSFDASAIATVAGNLEVQLYRNGVPLPQATATNTGAVTDSEMLTFEALVQVPYNNTCECCTAPVTIEVRNIGVAATFVSANLIVTKLC